MIEKGKISALQLAILLYPTIIATAVLSVPTETARDAKSDMWISPIWASLIGVLVVFVAFQLHKFYRQKTIIQYSEKILGKIGGKVLGGILILNLFFTNGVTTRQYAELIIGAFLPQTPMIVVIALLMLVCAFAVRGGLEVIGRTAQIFIPIYIASILLLILLLIPEFNVKNLFPIMEDGMIPSLKGASGPQAMFSLFILIAYLLPYVKEEEKAIRWSLLSVGAVMLTLVVINLTILFVFGHSVIKFVYPVLNASKYISVADFLEHIESIVVAVWVSGTFIKLSVQYYVTSLAIAQLIGLSDYRPLVFPVGLLNVLFSIWSIPNFSVLASYMGKTLPFYAFFFNVAVPCLLLLLAVSRKKMAKRNNEQVKEAH